MTMEPPQRPSNPWTEFEQGVESAIETETRPQGLEDGEDLCADLDRVLG